MIREIRVVQPTVCGPGYTAARGASVEGLPATGGFRTDDRYATEHAETSIRKPATSPAHGPLLCKDQSNVYLCAVHFTAWERRNAATPFQGFDRQGMARGRRSFSGLGS